VYIGRQFSYSFHVPWERKNILSLCVSVARSAGPHAYWIQRTSGDIGGARSIPSHLFLSGLRSGTVVACRDARYIDENTAIRHHITLAKRSELDLSGQKNSARQNLFSFCLQRCEKMHEAIYQLIPHVFIRKYLDLNVHPCVRNCYRCKHWLIISKRVCTHSVNVYVTSVLIAAKHDGKT